ncbi:hypothetical protein GCM10008094_25300 [Aidingimonas halophila]|nr:hypothetical protein GCM10008094_25300 [Aidingimonas halophila]
MAVLVEAIAEELEEAPTAVEAATVTAVVAAAVPMAAVAVVPVVAVPVVERMGVAVAVPVVAVLAAVLMEAPAEAVRRPFAPEPSDGSESGLRTIQAIG